MHRQHHAVSLLQATHGSPVLANLAALTRDSQARLYAIQCFIPVHLRTAVLAGPIEGDAWCLLASSTSTAAKIRQLIPTLIAALNDRGWSVSSIRVTVRNQAKRTS